MKRKMFQLRSGLFVTALLVVFYGCKDSSTGPVASGQLSLSTRYSTASLAKVSATSSAVDSIKITRARFVLKKIEFETTSDSAEFKSSPLVIDLNLTGSVQMIGVANLPFGTYREVEFKVHRIDSSNISSLSSVEKASFADFLAGEQYSIIIEGSVYKNGGAGLPFVVRSKVDAEQEYDLNPPLVVSEANPTANVTIVVSSSGWFRDSGGVLLDPTDGRNESLIGENLKASMKVYKDDDRDGERD